MSYEVVTFCDAYSSVIYAVIQQFQNFKRLIVLFNIISSKERLAPSTCYPSVWVGLPAGVWIVGEGIEGNHLVLMNM